jgi:nucleoside-diphosphate-sugar epimerase
MKVGLTGASGFIGSFIARHLERAGHHVVALVRETSRRDHIEDVVAQFIVGDQADRDAQTQLIKESDCIIHNSLDWKPLREDVNLAAHLKSNLVSSIEFLHAAAPRQFIYISSIAVHHDMRPRWGGVIDEDHPLRPASLYGACKAAVEAHLWAAHYTSGQPTCAFRPCGVYGLDPDLERTYGLNLIRKVRRGEGSLSKPGGGKFVHVDDVAAAVVAAVGNEHANARAFNLVDCYARWADWAKLACDVMGRTDFEIDFSSPGEPKNEFTKDAVRSLGVELNRGHEGIRTYLEELAEVISVESA